MTTITEEDLAQINGLVARRRRLEWLRELAEEPTRRATLTVAIGKIRDRLETQYGVRFR